MSSHVAATNEQTKATKMPFEDKYPDIDSGSEFELSDESGPDIDEHKRIQQLQACLNKTDRKIARVKIIDEFFDARKEFRALGEEGEKEEAAAKKEIVKKWKRERLEEMELELAERMELFMVWQEEEDG